MLALAVVLWAVKWMRAGMDLAAVAVMAMDFGFGAVASDSVMVWPGSLSECWAVALCLMVGQTIYDLAFVTVAACFVTV